MNQFMKDTPVADEEAYLEFKMIKWIDPGLKKREVFKCDPSKNFFFVFKNANNSERHIAFRLIPFSA